MIWKPIQYNELYKSIYIQLVNWLKVFLLSLMTYVLAHNWVAIYTQATQTNYFETVGKD